MIEKWQQRMVACMQSEEAKDVRVEEALAIKYEHRPYSVFKYREINERSLRNLENDLVWVCSPTDYNDPYDSSISITTETLTSTIFEAGVQELISQGLGTDLDADRLQKLLTGTNPAVALQEALLGQDEVPPEFWPPFIASFEAQVQVWKEAVKESLPGSHKASLKVCSFSATAESIIMWSHYADQHRGFCVEYDIHSLAPDNLFVRMMYPVIYSEKLFDATSYYLAALRDRQGFNMLFSALASLYKSPEWGYEKEWRLVIPASLLKESSPWRVPKPKRLYLGSRINEEHRELLLTISRKRNIEIHQMQLADDSFRLKSKLVS
ncbi:DUF2971 domain-containing protein [Granulicella sp. dw_53]|uniref:DUF2971 domain-containing protein n=1 Tax=Granulicella sp. dw_53 TaxID=2719792 RepID=UPI001BD2CA4D|nr:DUF2971 domain-containing protein [Granulicella sp. dw_53]